MDHLEAVVEIKNIINIDFIKKIIPLINKKAKNYLGDRVLYVGATKRGILKDIRNVKGYQLNFDNPTNILYWNYIKTEIERLFVYYRTKFPQMASSKINQIDLLKHSPDSNYKIHIDNCTTTRRALSIIMNLNDGYEGGYLIFTDQKHKEIKKLKLNKGSIVFFPSNFLYPHSITPIIKGTRYSIVAWLQ